MASIGKIDTTGKFIYWSGVFGMVSHKLKPGEKYTWHDTIFFDAWPSLPPVIILEYGTAKAYITRSSMIQVPNYEVRIEGDNANDLLKLMNICIRRLGGETTVIEPEPRQHSLSLGFLGDFNRFREWVTEDVKAFKQRLSR